MLVIRVLVAALFLLVLPGLARGQSAETDSALQLYTYKLVQTGMKIRSYPAEAQTRGEEGTVTVEISMNANRQACRSQPDHIERPCIARQSRPRPAGASGSHDRNTRGIAQ